MSSQLEFELISTQWKDRRYAMLLLSYFHIFGLNWIIGLATQNSNSSNSSPICAHTPELGEKRVAPPSTPNSWFDTLTKIHYTASHKWPSIVAYPSTIVSTISTIYSLYKSTYRYFTQSITTIRSNNSSSRFLWGWIRTYKTTSIESM